MTADDSRAVPDTDAVREAEAWFRERLDDRDRVWSGLLDRPEGQRHAATIVRAALARRVSAEPDPDSDMRDTRSVTDVIGVLRGWAAACRSHSYGRTPFTQGVKTGNLNAADGYDDAATTLAALARDVPAPADESLYEQLTAVQHEIWAHWMDYLLGQKATPDPDDGRFLRLRIEDVDHWQRQINTGYDDLSEREKASDREQVDRFWPLLSRDVPAGRDLTAQDVPCTEPLDNDVVGELAIASEYSDDPWLADRDRMQIVLDVLHERGMVVHRRAAAGPRADDGGRGRDLYRAIQYARDLEAGMNPEAAWNRARPAAGPRAGDTAVSGNEHDDDEHVSDRPDHGNVRAGDTAPPAVRDAVTEIMRDVAASWRVSPPEMNTVRSESTEAVHALWAQVAEDVDAWTETWLAAHPVAAAGPRAGDTGLDVRAEVKRMVETNDRLRSEVAELKQQRDYLQGQLDIIYAATDEGWQPLNGLPSDARRRVLGGGEER